MTSRGCQSKHPDSVKSWLGNSLLRPERREYGYQGQQLVDLKVYLRHVYDESSNKSGERLNETRDMQDGKQISFTFYKAVQEDMI